MSYYKINSILDSLHRTKLTTNYIHSDSCEAKTIVYHTVSIIYIVCGQTNFLPVNPSKLLFTGIAYGMPNKGNNYFEGFSDEKKEIKQIEMEYLIATSLRTV